MKQYIQIELEEAKDIINLLEQTKSTNPGITILVDRKIKSLDKKIEDTINLVDDEETLIDCLEYRDPSEMDKQFMSTQELYFDE